MIVKTLDNKPYPWKLIGCLVVGNKVEIKKSQLHLNARELLVQSFPTLQILEEVPIKPYNDLTLYLDFYLPLIQTAIEVHGQQHYQYSSLFHTSKWDFIRQVKNDKLKSEWCTVNNIDLIILPYNENIDEWKQRINN